MTKLNKIQADMKKKKELVLKALEKNLGNVSNACSQLNISRTQFYNWVKDDADFAEKWHDIEELSIDYAETSLKKQIKSGNTSATIFYLKCKAKNRGYIEKTEVDNTHTFIGGKPEEYED